MPPQGSGRGLGCGEVGGGGWESVCLESSNMRRICVQQHVCTHVYIYLHVYQNDNFTKWPLYSNR